MKVLIRSATGVEQRNSDGGFDVEQNASNIGFSPFTLPSNGPNTTVTPTITVPGMYFFSGSTACTGTIPAPDAFPGAFLSIVVTNAQPVMLTGSARAAGNIAGVFSVGGLSSGSLPGNLVTFSVGDKLKLQNSGSVNLWSDARYWIPVGSSGSILIQQ